MDEIRSAQEELSKVFSEAGQSFYQQQASQPSGEAPDAGATAGTPGEGNGAGKAEDVVEADYEIVDDKK
jgi:molecular chaperone DnaK